MNYLDGAAELLDGGEVRNGTNRTRFSFGDLPRNPNWQSDEIVMESIYRDDWDAYVATQKYHQVCRTSFLLQDELSRHVDLPRFLVAAIDAAIARRGLLIQLALIAYRLDHGQYPGSLAELAPDYLEQVPPDPYSQASFEYRPDGLSEPLLRGNLAAGTSSSGVPAHRIPF